MNSSDVLLAYGRVLKKEITSCSEVREKMACQCVCDEQRHSQKINRLKAGATVTSLGAFHSAPSPGTCDGNALPDHGLSAEGRIWYHFTVRFPGNLLGCYRDEKANPRGRAPWAPPSSGAPRTARSFLPKPGACV